MKNLFLDTNIIIDVIDFRMPFYTESAKILDYGAKNRMHLFISALSYNNIYYICKKTTSHPQCIDIMKNLASFITTIDVTQEIVDLALNSNFKDFEDAIQYFSALSIDRIDAIVTRNPKDFKQSKIPILLPQEVTIK